MTASLPHLSLAYCVTRYVVLDLSQPRYLQYRGPRRDLCPKPSQLSASAPRLHERRKDTHEGAADSNRYLNYRSLDSVLHPDFNDYPGPVW
jgi:hypothetical protein